MWNSANPSFIKGYAQPHAMAAVRAKMLTHRGRVKMEFFKGGRGEWFNEEC
jgi:hypothetical protein